MTTKDFREVLAALLAIKLRYDRAMSDGRLGYLDMAGFLRDVPAIKRAMEDIHKVPDELLDLTEFELSQISDEISKTLVGWGFSYRRADITNDVARGLIRSIPHLQAIGVIFDDVAAIINGRPLSALPV